PREEVATPKSMDVLRAGWRRAGARPAKGMGAKSDHADDSLADVGAASQSTSAGRWRLDSPPVAYYYLFGRQWDGGRPTALIARAARGRQGHFAAAGWNGMVNAALMLGSLRERTEAHMMQFFNQLVQFLQQGISSIFRFVQMIWTWSVGQ